MLWNVFYQLVNKYFIQSFYMEALIVFREVLVSNLETKSYHGKDNWSRVMCISLENLYHIDTDTISNTSLPEQCSKSLIQNLMPGIDLILYLLGALSKIITYIRFLIWHQQPNECRKIIQEFLTNARKTILIFYGIFFKLAGMGYNLISESPL